MADNLSAVASAVCGKSVLAVRSFSTHREERSLVAVAEECVDVSSSWQVPVVGRVEHAPLRANPRALGAHYRVVDDRVVAMYRDVDE